MTKISEKINPEILQNIFNYMREEEKYTYQVEWSEADSCFIVRCLEFPSFNRY